MEDLSLSRFLSLGGIDSRAQFVGRFVGATTFSATFTGLFCGQVGALLPCGPLLPFITGSVAGYLVGAMGFGDASMRVRSTMPTCIPA